MEDDKKGFLRETYEVFTAYVDDRLLLLKIQAAEKSGKLVAALVTMMVVMLSVFFILFFVSMMGGYYFAELTGSAFYGFSIIAGIHVFLLLLFLLLNKGVFSGRIIDRVIRIFFESREPLPSDDDE
jgi:hypothetical protein